MMMTMNTDYTVKLHENETMNFKWDDKRPIVKRVFEETYKLPSSCVLEQIEEMIDVPYKKIEDPKDLDYTLRQCLSEKEEKEFIEKNNKTYDFWKKIKPQIEEWMALYAERKGSNFKHFTIDLESLSWCNHSLDTPDDEDKSYIVISHI